MKSHTEYLVFETNKRREMVHITDQVEQIVKRSGVKDGLCFVSPMHITAAVYVNDLEGGLIEDIGKWLEELAPARPDYKHHQTGEDNGDAHLKSLLLHHETTLPVTSGKLDLGTWQRVFYAEFDGQRRKRVIVKVLGGKAHAIRRQDKVAYHAWGTFASPLLTALLATTEHVAAGARVNRREAKRRMLPILQQTLANYAALDAAGAFSGPIVRGDVETIRRHLRVLRKVPAAGEVYAALANAAVKYLPGKSKGKVRRLLNGQVRRQKSE